MKIESLEKVKESECTNISIMSNGTEEKQATCFCIMKTHTGELVFMSDSWEKTEIFFEGLEFAIKKF